MRDPRLDRYIASLDAAFDAAVAREEHEAASDLAFSLVQDRALRDRVARSNDAALVLAGGRSEPVTAVGEDYVAAGDPVRVVVPLTRAVVVRRAPRRPLPRTGAGTMLELLRSWARAGAVVTVEAERGSWTGRLTAAGRDHVVVADRAGETAIALGTTLSAARVDR